MSSLTQKIKEKHPEAKIMKGGKIEEEAQEEVQEEVQNEEKVEETLKTEETKEEVTEEPVEKADEKTEEAQEEEQVYDFKALNTVFGREEDQFEDLETAQTFFEEVRGKAEKVDQYESELTDLRSQVEEYNALFKEVEEHPEKYDPKVMFDGNEEALQRALLGEALKKKGVNPSVVDRILDPKFEGMDSLDIISVGAQLKNARLTGQDDAIKKNILSRLGVSFENEDGDKISLSEVISSLTPEQKVGLEMEAGKIVDEVKGLVSQVEVPEAPNFARKILDDSKTRKEKAQQLADAWQGKEVADKLSKELDVVDLSYEGLDFKYKVDELDKADLLKTTLLRAALERREVSEENITKLAEEAKASYIGRNAKKIYSAAIKQAKTQTDEKVEKEVYNGKKSDMSRSPNKAKTGESLVDQFKKKKTKKTPKKLH